MQRVFGNRTNGRNSHEGEHQSGIEEVQTSGDSERVLKPRRHQDHTDEADYDGRQCSEQFDKGFNDAARRIGCHFREICRRHQTERHRKETCQESHGSYKNDELGDPLINDHHAVALGVVTYDELKQIYAMTARINEVLKELFAKMNINLIDFKIEFGRTSDGEIVLADEVSPDTCRLWDMATNEKLDKDRFRRDLGKVREAYEEILARLEKVIK